jgi:hypothetical protein
LQVLKAGAKQRSFSAAAFHLQSVQANQYLSLISLERGDLATAQGLLDLSTWSDTHLAQTKTLLADRLESAAEGGIFKALLTVEGRKDKASAR